VRHVGGHRTIARSPCARRTGHEATPPRRRRDRARRSAARGSGQKHAGAAGSDSNRIRYGPHRSCRSGRQGHGERRPDVAWINEAVRTLGGQVEDREKLLAALRRVEIPDAPRGPIRLDSYGNPIQNVYIRKVERNRDGELQNTVILTIPGVSQFWKYNPEEFLRQPVYSRDVPACRYC
jgi:hypothetical protein